MQQDQFAMLLAYIEFRNEHPELSDSLAQFSLRLKGSDEAIPTVYEVPGTDTRA